MKNVHLAGDKPEQGSSVHTPGPWECVHSSWETSLILAHGKSIARADISDEVTEDTQARYETEKDANARLIAASPDLLAALQAMLKEFGKSDADSVQHIYEQARAAIARATGAV